MKQHIIIICSLLLISQSLRSQCPLSINTDCTLNYATQSGLNYTTNLCTAADGTGFELSSNLFQVINLDSDEIVDNDDNNWNDAMDLERAGLEAFLVAHRTQEIFCDLDYEFLTNSPTCYINSDLNPFFPDVHANETDEPITPYNDYGMSIPAVTPDFAPDVIVHELSHLYVNNNFPMLNTAGMDNSAIKEALCDIIGISIENIILPNKPEPWNFYGYRDLDFTLPANLIYNHPDYYSNNFHNRGLTGGHWAYLTSQACEWNWEELLEFILNSFSTDNGIICDYPSFRQQTLAYFHNTSGCNDCYISMVNAWAEVGVGEYYQEYFAPTLNQINTGPCSIQLSWSDQGTPQYTFELLNSAGEIVDNGCVNQPIYSNDDLEIDTYTFRVKPSCDTNDCSTVGDGFNVLTENDILVNGSTIPLDVEVTATECDLVFTIQDFGFNDDDVIFSVGQDLMSLDTLNNNFVNIYRPNNGFVYFHFNESNNANLHSTDIGLVWVITIPLNCSANGQDFLTESGVISENPNLFTELDVTNVIASSCFVQPESFTNFEFDDRLQTLVIPLTQAKYDSLSQAGTVEIIPFIGNENLFPNGTDFTSAFENFPMAPIPNAAQFIAVTANLERSYANPGLDFFADGAMNCFTRVYSDIFLFDVGSITGQAGATADLTICTEGRFVNLDFQINGDIESISHIEYRYKYANETEWSMCHSTLGGIININDHINFGPTEACAGGVEVEYRIINNCSDPCQTPWPQTQDPTISTTNYTDCQPPNFISAEHCGDKIVVFYDPSPGVYSHNFYLMPNSINASTNMIVCTSDNTGCLNNFINNPVLDVGTVYTNSICPYGYGTMHFENVDPNLSYTVYVQSICCDDEETINCDNNNVVVGDVVSLDCYLQIDIVNPCSFDVNQNLNIDNITETSMEVSWTDTDPNLNVFAISAILNDATCTNPPSPIIEVIDENEANTNLGPNYSIIIDGLIPGKNYIIQVEKVCTTLLCSTGLSIVDEKTTLPIPEAEITDVCLPESGSISFSFSSSIPDNIGDILNISGPGLTDVEVDNENNKIVYYVDLGGNYTVTLNSCGDIISSDLSVSGMDCTPQLISTTDCALHADCITGNDEDLFYTWEIVELDGIGNVTQVLYTIEGENYFQPFVNGNYRVCVSNDQCVNLFCSGVINVDCTAFDASCLSTEEDYNNTIFIDGTNNSSMLFWVNYWNNILSSNPFTGGNNSFDLLGYQVVFNGNLIIDVNLNVFNCEFVGNENSEIVIEEGRNFLASNTTFSSCNPNEAWRGINVQNSSFQLLDNSSISYAQMAISADDGALLSVHNSILSNNNTGIWGRDGVLNPGSTFSNNQFIGSPGLIGGIGIDVSNMIFRYVDSGISTFQGLRHPIRTRDNSTTTFENIIIKETIENYGITIDGDLSTRLKNIEITGGDHSGINLRDIEGSPQIILQDITINVSGNFGIYIDDCSGTNLDLQTSTITAQTGIEINDTNFSSALIGPDINVTANRGVKIFSSSRIEINDPSIIATQTGVLIQNSNKIEIQGKENSEITSQGFGIAASTGPSGALSIRDMNIFSNTNSGTDILFFGTSDHFICGNNLKGLNIGTSFNNCSSEVELTYAQNTHTNPTALIVKGSAIGPNPHAGNLFSDGSEGEIEPGLEPGSEFLVNPGDPILQGSTFNIRPQDSGIGNLNIWFQSDQFMVTNAFSCRNSDPFNPPIHNDNEIGIGVIKPGDDDDGTGDPDFDNDDPDGDGTNDPPGDDDFDDDDPDGDDHYCCNSILAIKACCPDPVVPTCEMLLTYVEDILSNADNELSHSQQMIAIMDVLNNLEYYELYQNQIPGLIRNCYDQIQILINEQLSEEEQEPMLRVIQYEQEIEQLYEMEESLKKDYQQYLLNINNLEKEILAIQQDYPENTEQVRIMLNEILLNKSKITAIKESFQSKIVENQNEIINDLANFRSEDEYFTFLTEAYLDLVEVKRTNQNTYINQNKQRLMDRAILCPEDYGFTVYFSRILLEKIGGPEAHDGYGNGCIESRDVSSTSNKNTDFIITPNPTAGHIGIYNSLGFKSTEIELISLDGHKIKQYTFNSSEKSIILERDNIADGIYFLKIRKDGQTHTRKLILVNN